MTREELKEHCEKQIEMCELWAIGRGEEPSGKIYEEHKLILELLEQEPILDKIRAEIEEVYLNITYKENHKVGGSWGLRKALDIIDKYKAESEDKMADNIFENLTDEEQKNLWMYMIFNADKIKAKTEQWSKEAEKAGMTLTEYLESINPLDKAKKENK